MASQPRLLHVAIGMSVLVGAGLLATVGRVLLLKGDTATDVVGGDVYPVYDGDAWRYINIRGEYVTEHTYEQVYKPKWSQLGKRDGRWYVVCADGREEPIKVPDGFEFAGYWDAGYCVARKEGDESKKEYLYHHQTQELIPRAFDEVGHIREGCFAFREGSKWGYADLNGDTVIPAQYGFAVEFSEGLALVQKNRRWYAINSDGDVAFALPEGWSGSKFREGILSCVDISGDSGEYFVNRAGEVVAGPYQRAGWFSEGLASIKKDGKVGYIDTTGKVIIEPQYKEGWRFLWNRAYVQRFDGVWLVISPLGIVEKVLGTQRPTESEVRLLSSEHTDGPYGLVNSEGEWIWQTDDMWAAEKMDFLHYPPYELGYSRPP